MGKTLSGLITLCYVVLYFCYAHFEGYAMAGWLILGFIAFGGVMFVICYWFFYLLARSTYQR